MKEIFYLLSPLIAILTVIFSVTLFVYLKSSAPAFVKALLIPACLLLCLIIPLIFWTFIGVAKPVSSLPPKIQVIAYNILVSDGKKDRVEIWYDDHGSTKLVSIVYSKGLETALKEIAEARGQGEERALISKDGASKGSGSVTRNDEQSYRSELVPPNHGLPPK